MKLDTWTDNQTQQKRNRLSVRADRVQFIGGGQSNQTAPQQEPYNNGQPVNSFQDYQKGGQPPSMPAAPQFAPPRPAAQPTGNWRPQPMPDSNVPGNEPEDDIPF